ncbi:glycosyltransferase 87 family protein [Gordonia sp. ABSL1-1]|uniref:glycosyltransferase 87 family protein n=1 Tax=Gordonia sp. ABSL1-1 TaxID=3053923 RepID=UPI002572ECC6|nr:glycosyltransferase 87 family protein [Gordonia sp. ABSL1-1]MDL9935939.1 glycosyltransferase 87 family protein [Gordonia sp. ABSL1-1]
MTVVVDGYLRSSWARAAAAVALVVATFAFVFVFPGGAFTPYHVDYDVYRTGAQVYRDGGDLYGTLPQLADGTYLPFTYPPIAAALFTVFTPIPLGIGAQLFTVFSILCLILVLRLVMVSLIDRPSAQVWWLVVPVAALSLGLGPVRDTLTFGQVNIVLMALVVVDLLRGRGRWWSGTLIGLAIAVKLTPLVFVLLLVLRRDLRSAVVAVVSALVWTLLGYLLMPAASAEYWQQTLRDTSRIGNLEYADNLSINGVLRRLGIDSGAVWFVLAGLAGLLVVWATWRLLRADSQVGAMLAVSMAALLCSPVAWEEHWVWVSPLLVTMAVWGAETSSRRVWWPLTAVGLVVLYVAAHHRIANGHQVELDWTWWQHLAGASYLIWGLAVLVAMGRCARDVPVDITRRRPTAPSPSIA